MEILNSCSDCDEIQFTEDGNWSPMRSKKEVQEVSGSYNGVDSGTNAGMEPPPPPLNTCIVVAVFCLRWFSLSLFRFGRLGAQTRFRPQQQEGRRDRPDAGQLLGGRAG